MQDIMITYEKTWLTAGDRLAVLGDSLTHNASGYMQELTAVLAKKGITVINAGLGGDKTPTALMRLQHEVIDMKPTAVSVFLGTNDALVGRGIWADEPRVTPSAYYTNLRWIMTRCRMAEVSKFSVTPPLWRHEGDQFAAFGDIFRDYCLEARAAADDERAIFVPADIAIQNEWAKHPGHTGLLLTRDGIHLTEEGCAILVKTTLKAWGME
jgi:acyl-CoA thioesterase I